MSLDPTALFGGPLGPDPAVALVAPPIPPADPAGPMRVLQFVIELVGDHSVPAQAAASLMTSRWQQALGQPSVFAMRPSDTTWQPLTTQTVGSYDSLALAWDMLSPRGSLSNTSAARLQQVAEEVGRAMGRRAMPLPVPTEVDARVRGLREAQESLDIGFGLGYVPSRGDLTEKAIWVLCSRLGLDIGPSGTFEWRVQGHPLPLLEVSPMGEADGFSLRAVQLGVVHPGVSVGFSVPLSPAPLASLEAVFRVIDTFLADAPGLVVDEEGHAFTSSARDTYRGYARQATDSLAANGLRAGGSAALRLFAGL